MPAVINEPAYKVSPGPFLTAIDSPVNKDSLTSISPSITIQSAEICFPFLNLTMSSKTNSLTGNSFVKDSLITVVVGAVTIESLSIVFLALISWTIPIFYNKD